MDEMIQPSDAAQAPQETLEMPVQDAGIESSTGTDGNLFPLSEGESITNVEGMPVGQTAPMQTEAPVQTQEPVQTESPVKEDPGRMEYWQSQADKAKHEAYKLQQQVKQLSGDLQTAQRESVHDRKRVEIKEFEKKLAKAEAKVEMATTLHNKRSQDELDKLKDAVSEVEKDTKDRPPRKVVPITV